MRVIAVQNPNTASTNGLFTAIHMQIGALSSFRTMGDIKFVRNNGFEGKWYFTASTTAGSGTHADLIAFSNSDFTYKGNNVWHAGNDGSSSGLDADLLDGYHQTDFVRLAASSSSPTNGTFAIGSASGRNFVQSHSSQPLDLNPLGNQVFINGSEAVRNTGTWSISVTGTAGSETLATVTGRGASASVEIVTSSGFQGRFYRVSEASANRGGLYPYNLILGSGTDYSLGLFSEGELYLASGGSATKRFTMNSSGVANFTGNLTAANLSGTNTGDQTNISGSSSTVSHFASRTDSTSYNVVWAAGNPSHLYSCDAVKIQSSTGTLTATTLSSTNLSISDGNVELYKYQTIDMSGGSFNTSNYYPVIIGVPTSGVTIQIQNNLNSNVPSWSTHPSGFSINLIWTTNASGWGTTAINRSVLQWTERFSNVTICGGINQMGTSSQEVVWLRGGGVYYFIFSRNISGFASSSNYTNPYNTESANVSASIVNSPWGQSIGRMSYGEIYSPGDVIAYSDASVKENIRPIDNALERVLSTRGVIYDRIDTQAKDNIGFIAQEMEVKNPELVVTDESGKKSVKYQNTTALLIEAVKELNQKVEDQALEIRSLKGLVGSLLGKSLK